VERVGSGLPTLFFDISSQFLNLVGLCVTDVGRGSAFVQTPRHDGSLMAERFNHGYLLVSTSEPVPMGDDENTVRRVQIDGSSVLLVGTAHVSKDSVEQVRDLIAETRPEIVAVELCEPRYKVLLDRRKWEQTPLTKLIKGDQPYFFLGQSFMAMMQRSLGDELGVEPGAEMLAAIRAAKDVGAEIALVDRKIAVTLKRAWNKMSLREKFRIFRELLYGFFGVSEMSEEIDIEMLKRQDIITEMMEELGKMAPKAKEVLVDERDAYIAGKLKNLAAENPGKSILAVVGAGHLNGLVENLKREEEPDLEELDSIPSSILSLKLVGYMIPVAFLAIFIWTIYSRGWADFLDIVFKLFWIGGGLRRAGGACTPLRHRVGLPRRSLRHTQPPHSHGMDIRLRAGAGQPAPGEGLPGISVLIIFIIISMR